MVNFFDFVTQAIKFLIAGLCAVIIASAVITTATSGRLHFFGYLLTSFLYSGLILPLVLHWIWHGNGFFHKKVFLNYKVSAKDYGGSLVIHVTAGMTSLIAVVYLGRRLLRLYEIDESSIGTESPAMTLIGYVFIVTGLIAFTIPVKLYIFSYNYFGLILINNMLAMSGSILTVIALSFLLSRKSFHYWIIIRCIQAAIAGLVSVSAGVDVYTPFISFLIAIVGGIIFYTSSRLIHYSSLEDYCNVISIHLVCGVFGLILPPYLASSQNLGFSVSVKLKLLHCSWQLISCLATIGYVFISFSLFYLFLLVTGFLRNRNEKINHNRSVNLAENHPDKCCLQRLFTLYSDTPFLEPGPAGKNPDDNVTIRKSYNFERARTPSMNFFKSREKIRASERSENFPARDDAGINEETRSEFKAPPPRNTIFTVQNVERILESHVNGGLDCAGDYKHEPKNSITLDGAAREIVSFKKEVDDEIIEDDDDDSYIPLHRTRKHTNLCRKKNKGRQSEREKDLNKIEYLYEKTEMDKFLDDGFITIKPVKSAENNILS